uniref:Cysteine protease n=1 Tax=Rhizochromulina marina TaxID=1034831 RepID=A0A7S2S9E2_9STRA
MSTLQPESLFFDPLLHIPPEPTAPPPSEPVTNPTWDASLLLLIPLRLGLESVPPEHAARILAMLELPQSIGFIGGRPNHAIYFFGHHGNELHGLDPHTTQPTPEVEDEEFPSLEFLASLSCPRPQKLRVDRLDPSLALGFYFRSWEDLNQWHECIEEMAKDGGPMPFRVEMTTPAPAEDPDPLDLTFEDDIEAATGTNPVEDEDGFLLI